METRRGFVSQVASVLSFATLDIREAVPERVAIQFRAEQHQGSAESLKGFLLLLQRRTSPPRVPVLIAPAVQELTPAEARDLSRRVRTWGTLILETGLSFADPSTARTQVELLRQTFDFSVSMPSAALSCGDGAGLQVRYHSPSRHLTRSFGAVTPVKDFRGEVLASYGAHPVCVAKQWGEGRLIYLGSNLGSNLFAEEREALAIGDALLDRL